MTPVKPPSRNSTRTPSGATPTGTAPSGAGDLWVEHLSWVRRLALRLARDEAGADDLVQRTALVALRRRDAVRAASADGGIRGWLRRVLYHEARSGWRQERNRRAREVDYAGAGPPAAEGPDAAAGSLEFTKRLVAAVEGLDEPYRAAVVSRYFHGQSVSEIALDQGVPARTVETRLRRAREKMRAGLSSIDGRGTGSWAPMVLLDWGGSDLGGLVASSAAAGTSIGTSASAVTKTAAAAPSGGAWLAGIVAMNVKIVLGCTAALVVGLVGVLQWGTSDGSAAVPDAAQQADALGQRPGPGDLVAVAGGGRQQEEPIAPVETASPAPEPTSGSFVPLIEALPAGTLDVWVVDEDSKPVVGAEVLIAEGLVFTGWAPPKVGEERPRQVQSVGSDPAIPVRFEGLAIGSVYLQVTSPSGARRVKSVKLDAKRGSTAILRFGSGRVFGRVTDGTGTGTPIEGAYIVLSTRRHVLGFTEEQKAISPPLSWSTEEASSLHVMTDRNGDFSFDELVAGLHRLSLDGTVMNLATGAQIEIPARYLGLELGPGEARRMDFPPGAEAGAAVWTGRVVDARGDPVVTPDFQFRSAVLRVASWGEELSEKPATFQARGNADFDERIKYGIDGTFELRLPPGRYDVWISSPHHKEWLHVVKASEFELVQGETVTRNLTLPGITLRGTVDAALEDMVRSWSKAQPFGKDCVVLSARQSHVTYGGGILHGGIEASGTFTLYGLEPGDWILSALGKTGGRTELTISEDATEVSAVLLPK